MNFLRRLFGRGTNLQPGGPDMTDSPEPIRRIAATRATFQPHFAVPGTGDYRFIALDVETASDWVGSICQIGLATVDRSNTIRTFTMLIDPECNFDPRNSAIHGITEQMVEGQPTFAAIFPQIRLLLVRYPIVQHSSFDQRAIESACNGNDLDCAPIHWIDSVRVAQRAWPEWRGDGGHGLANLKSKLGLQFRHHDAGEDARAAAEVVLAAERQTGQQFHDLIAPRPKSRTYEKSIPKEGNPDGVLAGQVVVFTGSLSMPRGDAAMLAASCGCSVKASVTMATTLVVVGDQDLTLLAGHEKSSKHRKAEELISGGQPIRIMGEAEFTEMVRQAMTGRK
jgi:DNA polymerase III subunit epsilon